MRKPIFIISKGYSLSGDAWERMINSLKGKAELNDEYHVLVFDNDSKGNQFCVLNGEYDDIQDLEDYLKELKSENN